MSSRKLLALERRQFIMEFLRKNRSVDVSFLSGELGVSEVTIRKDLEKLEQDRFLVRSHGGAVLNKGLLIEPSFVEKEDRLRVEKAAIAHEAARLVGDDVTVALSTGTTVGQMTGSLLQRTGLTVVTNAVNVASAFMQHSQNHVFITGGMVRPNTFALVGEAAERSLDGLACEYAFIGTDGLNYKHGMTTPSADEARVVRALMSCAARVVLLVDHSKFDHVAFYRIAPVESIDIVITDAQAPQDQLEHLRQAGVDVRIADN